MRNKLPLAGFAIVKHLGEYKLPDAAYAGSLYELQGHVYKKLIRTLPPLRGTPFGPAKEIMLSLPDSFHKGTGVVVLVTLEMSPEDTMDALEGLNDDAGTLRYSCDSCSCTPSPAHPQPPTSLCLLQVGRTDAAAACYPLTRVLQTEDCVCWSASPCVHESTDSSATGSWSPRGRRHQPRHCCRFLAASCTAWVVGRHGTKLDLTL